VTDARRLRKGDPIIEIERADVYDDGTHVLRDFSLCVRKGEHVAVLGPNGAGKTSLLRLVTTELRPYYREPPTPYRMFGRDRWLYWELYPRLGVVTPGIEQRNRRELTGREIVYSGFFGTIGVHQTLDDAQRRQAERIIRRLGLGRLADRTLAALSTGEARKFVLARALVHEPDLLVLDEPTSGLDVGAAADLLERIGRLARLGTTLVITTHHVEDIIPEVSHVVLLRRGAVVAAGPKASVLRSRPLSELFGVPVRVERRNGRYRMARV
jgi:iron complex transport system ATP-binding protein